jgi:Flp pilus assembly protein TadD
VNLAIALAGGNELGEAIVQYREALRIQPDDPHVYSQLGDVLERTGHVDQAAAAYREAVRLDPANVIARRRLSALAGEAVTSAPSSHPTR